LPDIVAIAVQGRIQNPLRNGTPLIHNPPISPVQRMPSQIGKLNSIALRSDFEDPLHGFRGRRCIQCRNPAITLRKPVSAQSSSTVPQSSCSRCRRTASVFSWLTIIGLGKVTS